MLRLGHQELQSQYLLTRETTAFKEEWSFENNPFKADPSDPISILGALPYPRPPTPSPPFITFTFTPLNILNSVILGPASCPLYKITTDPAMPDYTMLTNVGGNGLALIEWQTHPLVEVRGVLAKKETQTWLKLSKDKTCRQMDIHGTSYTWTTCGDFVCLYKAAHMRSDPLARISRSTNSVVLQMSPQAVQSGLLDPCLTVTLLLQCGRNID